MSPVDPQQNPSPSRPSRVLRVIFAVVLVFGITYLLTPRLLGLIMAFALRGSSSSVAPADATRSVTVSLMHWGLLGTVPDNDPGYTNFVRTAAGRMTGINGFTESDGFHGDGTDWYEVELSPDFAAELRSALAQSTTIKKSRRFPDEHSAPSWWPKTWPADAQCYDKDSEHLVLPDSGTRAWFMRMRT